MTQEKNTTEAPALDGSAFARVLARIMKARGIPANEETALELAERSGLDRDVFRGRLAAELDVDLGDLSRLAEELGELTESERLELAYAYTFERERPTRR